MIKEKKVRRGKMKIPEEDKKELLKLARESIRTALDNEELRINNELKRKYSKKQGVFVTLNTKTGELRGCIGYPEPIMPLWRGIINAARAAAFEDPRFYPITKEELKDIIIEISILTPPELIKVKHPIEYLNKIKIEEDGLIIRGPFGSGLLLPQVFIEYNATPEQALRMVCQKAMLPSNAWQDLRNKIYKFQAEVFSEKEIFERE